MTGRFTTANEERGYAVDNEARENRERLSAINLAADRASARQRTNE